MLLIIFSKQEKKILHIFKMLRCYFHGILSRRKHFDFKEISIVFYKTPGKNKLDTITSQTQQKIPSQLNILLKGQLRTNTCFFLKARRNVRNNNNMCRKMNWTIEFVVFCNWQFTNVSRYNQQLKALKKPTFEESLHSSMLRNNGGILTTPTNTSVWRLFRPWVRF